jgi:hypothetical protein
MGYLVYFGRKYTTQNDKERISYLLYTKKRMNTRIPTKKAAFSFFGEETIGGNF